MLILSVREYFKHDSFWIKWPSMSIYEANDQILLVADRFFSLMSLSVWQVKPIVTKLIDALSTPSQQVSNLFFVTSPVFLLKSVNYYIINVSVSATGMQELKITFSIEETVCIVIVSHDQPGSVLKF